MRTPTIDSWRKSTVWLLISGGKALCIVYCLFLRIHLRGIGSSGDEGKKFNNCVIMSAQNMIMRASALAVLELCMRVWRCVWGLFQFDCYDLFEMFHDCKFRLVLVPFEIFWVNLDKLSASGSFIMLIKVYLFTVIGAHHITRWQQHRISCWPTLMSSLEGTRNVLIFHRDLFKDYLCQ